MNPKEDSLVSFLVLNTGTTYKPFTPFVECPNCRKLLRVGLARCPDCYEEVTEEYAFGSAVAVVANTVACDLANHILGFDAFAVIAVILSVFVIAGDLLIYGSAKLALFVVVWPIIPLSLTVLWFFRFGRFDFPDDDYQNAKRGLRRTLGLWLAILAAQVIALVFLRF
jgi:hypothetical protein